MSNLFIMLMRRAFNGHKSSRLIFIVFLNCFLDEAEEAYLTALRIKLSSIPGRLRNFSLTNEPHISTSLFKKAL